MSRIAFVDGRYGALHEAAIRIEDRGFQFADGIYEVWSVDQGRLLDAEGHFARLWRSLDELQIAHPMSQRALQMVLFETLRRNRVRNGFIYLQITRGAAPRDHAFPIPEPEPTVVVVAKPSDRKAIAARASRGVQVISAPDERWARCDIKSVGLLANVLAKQKAREAGAFEAWLVDANGLVTEGTSSNAWIVDQDGIVCTRDLRANILHGVTRATLLRLAAQHGLKIEERPFTLAQAKAAREAFISSASSPAIPVVGIDGAQIGDGKPGPIAQALFNGYLGAALT
jgi:D-alanine transaminase